MMQINPKIGMEWGKVEDHRMGCWRPGLLKEFGAGWKSNGILNRNSFPGLNPIWS